MKHEKVLVWTIALALASGHAFGLVLPKKAKTRSGGKSDDVLLITGGKAKFTKAANAEELANLLNEIATTLEKKKVSKTELDAFIKEAEGKIKRYQTEGDVLAKMSEYERNKYYSGTGTDLDEKYAFAIKIVKRAMDEYRKEKIEFVFRVDSWFAVNGKEAKRVSPLVVTKIIAAVNAKKDRLKNLKRVAWFVAKISPLGQDDPNYEVKREIYESIIRKIVSSYNAGIDPFTGAMMPNIVKEGETNVIGTLQPGAYQNAENGSLMDFDEFRKIIDGIGDARLKEIAPDIYKVTI